MQEPESSHTSLPTVSVCIPTLGRPSLLDRAVPSVVAQGEAVAQLVIGVHDAQLALADHLPPSPPSTLVRYEGEGVAGVRNAAASAATGDLLLFLDDDDELQPGAVDHLRRLAGDPSIGFACGSAEISRADGHAETIGPEDLGALYHGLTAVFLAGTFVVRRDLFEQLGGYDEMLRFGENYDLGIRIAQAVHAGEARAAWTSEVVVQCAPSGNPYRDERAEAASRTLEKYPQHLAALGRQRATLHAILGVYRWRLRERAAARRHLRAAVRAAPGDPRHWARLAVSLVPALADRRWRP